MKYLFVIVILVIFILLISYYQTITQISKELFIETFMPPSETSISNDVELKKILLILYIVKLVQQQILVQK